MPFERFVFFHQVADIVTDAGIMKIRFVTNPNYWNLIHRYFLFSVHDKENKAQLK